MGVNSVVSRLPRKGVQTLMPSIWLGILMVPFLLALGWAAHTLAPEQWLATWQTPVSQLDLAQLQWRFALLPRLVMALLVGASLGLAGALLQQALRNPLAAPEILGIQSGALLALALSLLFAPALLLLGREWVAFAGGGLAMGLVLLFAAKERYTTASLLLSGMVVSLLCSALLVLLLLRHDLALMSLASLRAGALDQDGWQPALTLSARLVGVGLLLWLLRRPLGLLVLDDEGARSFGASPRLLRLVALGLAVYLSASVVSLVGAVGFVSLAAPLLVRLCGIGATGFRQLASALAGAALLLLADLLVQYWQIRGGGDYATGSVVALLGAPLLLVLLLRLPLLPAQGEPEPLARTQRRSFLPAGGIVVLLLLGLVLGLLFSRQESGWQWLALDGEEASLLWRLPRVLAALAAGLLLSVAGVLVQRLTGNPLASPEVLGISSGCGIGLILLGLCYPQAGVTLQWLTAAGSALLVMLLLLWWSRRESVSPLRLLLCGMAITAICAAAQDLVLASGDARGVQLLSWMAGSTYYVSLGSALTLLLLAVLLLPVALLLARWLDLLPLGESTAVSFGVDRGGSRILILGLASLLTAAATLLVGPVTFVGLLAPHLARRLGGYRACDQLWMAAGIGMVVMLFADWAGRQWLFPDQIPAGLMASLLGGSYFMLTLWRYRR